MTEIRSHFTLYGKSPLLQLGASLLIILTAGAVLFIALFLAGILISGRELETISASFLNDQGDGDINLLRYILIIQEIAVLMVPALLIRQILLDVGQRSHKDFGFPHFNELALVVMLAFCLFPVSGITAELNSHMQFPNWLSGVEEWMRYKEDEAAGLINMILPSDTVGIMFLNLVIVALLPAISEELLFRGVFQRIFYGFFKSPHGAIWLTASLFSAIHLQFYGFIPRLILGLAFGYLYYWGGTLWLPVLAHFVNNAVPVVTGYLNIIDTSGADADIDLWKQLLILPAPLIFSAVILLYFRNKYNQALSMKNNHDQI